MVTVGESLRRRENFQKAIGGNERANGMDYLEDL